MNAGGFTVRQWAWMVWHTRPLHRYGIVLLRQDVYCYCGALFPEKNT